MRRMNAAAMKEMLEKEIHEPEMYAHHRQGLVVMMERCVLQIAGINLNHDKHSTQEIEIPQYYISRTAVLVVMPNPGMPEFLGEITSNTGFLLAMTIQFAANEMEKRILA